MFASSNPLSLAIMALYYKNIVLVYGLPSPVAEFSGLGVVDNDLNYDLRAM